MTPDISLARLPVLESEMAYREAGRILGQAIGTGESPEAYRQRLRETWAVLVKVISALVLYSAPGGGSSSGL